jgi:hypothetical protein
MRKTTIYLSEEDERLLQEAAARRGSSRTEFIREAIRLAANADAGAPRRRPRPLGRSGYTDTSERVDELLGELGFGLDRP